MSDSEPKRQRGVFDDALKGYYQDHDEVLPEENVDYKSLNAESVGSLILGFLSVLTFISVLFLIFPIMGIVLGVTAIRKILRATQELAGLGPASAGVALSALLAVAGTSYQVYMMQNEVPIGYEPIDFTMLAAGPLPGQIPNEILHLTQRQDERGNVIPGTPIFIEGYMFPPEQMTDIKNFVLVPSIQQNQFGSPTRDPLQMINVSLLEDIRVSYRSSRVKVGGMLIVNPNRPFGETPYSLKADIFR